MVEFVSYDIKYPYLCCRKLVLKINGEERTLPGYYFGLGGDIFYVGDSDETTTISIHRGIELPEDLEPIREEIEDCISENLPYCCYGGCI